MPEKRTSATTTTIASPPRTRPTIAIARSTMRSEMPPDSISAPARMKSGIARSTNESTPPRILIGRMIRLDAANPEQIRERREREREGKRHAQRRGDEESGHEHDQRRRVHEQRNEHRRDRHACRTERPRERRSVAPHLECPRPGAVGRAPPPSGRVRPAGPRKSPRPTARSRAAARPALATVKRHAGTTSQRKKPPAARGAGRVRPPAAGAPGDSRTSAVTRGCWSWRSAEMPPTHISQPRSSLATSSVQGNGCRRT